MPNVFLNPQKLRPCAFVAVFASLEISILVINCTHERASLLRLLTTDAHNNVSCSHPAVAQASSARYKAAKGLCWIMTAVHCIIPCVNVHSIGSDLPCSCHGGPKKAGRERQTAAGEIGFRSTDMQERDYYENEFRFAYPRALFSFSLWVVLALLSSSLLARIVPLRRFSLMEMKKFFLSILFWQVARLGSLWKFAEGRI